jgi:group II intron reverse transcriptase/maturase
MAKGMTGLRSLQRKHVRIRQAEQHMQTSLRGIAKRAKENPKQRIGNVYSLLTERNLRWCFGRLNRKAAPGVDGADWQSYRTNLDENIRLLAGQLKEKRYKARLIRRHYIPKGNGRRPLGIPIVGDKLVQSAGAEILTAIYEEDFLETSHGYRRGRSPQRAALQLSKTLQRGRYGWVVDADIKGFFDHMDHDWIEKMLQERIHDRSFLKLIRKWLKAGILEEDGAIEYPLTGTPQGGVISAVLANIYLHYALDLWFEKVVRRYCRGAATMLRFADDFVCCFQYHADAQRFMRALTPRLAKFNLSLSTEKTRLLRFSRFVTKEGESFDFLGFTYRWGLSRKGNPLVRMTTSKKKLKGSLQRTKRWLRKAAHRLPLRRIMESLRAKLQGHWNYYGVCGNYPRLQEYYQQVIRLLYKWLNRRSQRRSYSWSGLKQMLSYYPLPRPRIIAYWE